MASFSKTLDVNFRKPLQKKKILWASRLSVGRRKENDEKKNSGGTAFKHGIQLEISFCFQVLLYTVWTLNFSDLQLISLSDISKNIICTWFK